MISEAMKENVKMKTMMIILQRPYLTKAPNLLYMSSKSSLPLRPLLPLPRDGFPPPLPTPGEDDPTAWT